MMFKESRPKVNEHHVYYLLNRMPRFLKRGGEVGLQGVQ